MNLLRLITARKGAAGFTPAHIANLKLWLDPTKNSSFNGGSIADGVKVSSWNDQSTAGTNVSQANSSYQPTYAASGINGNPAVYYGATTLGLNGTFSSTLTSFTVFAVVRSASNTNYNTILGDTASSRFSVTTTNANSIYTIANNYDLTSSTSNGSFLTNTNYVVTANISSSNKKIYINNVDLSTPSGNIGSLTSFGVGGRAWYTGFSGYIGHVLVYSGVLSDADRTAVYNYLKTYAGI